MNQSPIVQRMSGESAIKINSVLKNTYLLLSCTLLFSAAMAWYAMSIGAAQINLFVFIGGLIALNWITVALRNSPWGILAAFAYTGFLGFVLGPILNFYIHGFSNGPQLVMTSLGATGIIFFALSAYTIATRKNYSYMGGFLFAGVLTVFLVILASIFIQMPMLNLLISGAICLLASGYILYITSNIIHGGETNYIMATVTLYVSIYNLFVSLLHLIGAFSSSD